MGEFDDFDKFGKADEADKAANSKHKPPVDRDGGSPNAYAPSGFEIGFRNNLSDHQIDRLRSQLVACCYLYAISFKIPVHEGYSDDPRDDHLDDRRDNRWKRQSEDTERSSSRSSNNQSDTTRSDPDASQSDGSDRAGQGANTPAPSRPATIRPISSPFIKDIPAAVWDRTLAGMRTSWRRERAYWYFARYLATSPKLTPTGDDVRLVRLCALRIAARSRSDSVSIAALVDLLALLAEIMADPATSRRQSAHARRLARTALLHLTTQVKLRIDDPSISIWTMASSIWLAEINFGRGEELLTGDIIAQDLQRLIRQAPRQKDEMDELELKESDRSNTSREGGDPKTPSEPKAPQAGSEPDTRPSTDQGLTERSDAVVPARPDQTPTMQIMTSLNLAVFADQAKLDHAKQFRGLTHPIKLTVLPSYSDTTQRLAVLQTRMPNFGPVIQALLADFALAGRSVRTPVLRLRPLLLLGRPGIGKTRFVKELAEALGAKWSYLSTAGDADNRRFAGTAAGYSTAHPAWPVDQINELQRANPILVLDEIEKAGGGVANGNITHSLLPLLEPDSAKLFRDPFLGGQADLSAISWILLANTTEGLSGPLLSRVTKFEIEPPGPDAFAGIVETILLDLAADHRIEPADMPRLPELFLAELKAIFIRRPDIRRLKSALGRALGLMALHDNEHDGETVH